MVDLNSLVRPRVSRKGRDRQAPGTEIQRGSAVATGPSYTMVLNRTQLLVIGFLVLVWIALVAILLLSPQVYAQTLRQVGGDNRAVESSFLIALSALITLLVVGVFRRWRWTFWLILVAFFFGVLRLPASVLQIAGILATSGPSWYEALQGAIGVAQFLIALAMFMGYRKGVIWG